MEGATPPLPFPSLSSLDTYLRNVVGLTPVYPDNSFTICRNEEI